MCFKQSGDVVLIAVLAFVISPTVKAQQSVPEQIYWVESDQQAISLARQFNLPILAYVASDRCGYCRKMERNVWSNPGIVSMVEAGFVPLKVIAKKDAATIARLNVRAFPTILLFSPEARLTDRAAGYLPPNQLAGLLRRSVQAHLASHPAQRPE